MPKATALLLAALLLSLGCSGPALTSRVVQQDSSWFVRLDLFQNAEKSSGRYDHPATWTIDELSAVLSRLLLEDRVGLMDRARPPRPLFSSEEIVLLAPAIVDSFRRATPSEWVSFSLSSPGASGVIVTSGGMFLADSRFHVIIANHRALLAKDSEEPANVRANPLRSIRGSGGTLTFESARFVTGTQPNWSGSHRVSASELILDHRAFLSFFKLPGAVAPAQALGLVPPATSSAPGPHRDRPATTGETDAQMVILRLREEVERLKKTVEAQEAEIVRLKHAADQPSRSSSVP